MEKSLHLSSLRIGVGLSQKYFFIFWIKKILECVFDLPKSWFLRGFFYQIANTYFKTYIDIYVNFHEAFLCNSKDNDAMLIPNLLNNLSAFAFFEHESLNHVCSDKFLFFSFSFLRIEGNLLWFILLAEMWFVYTCKTSQDDPELWNSCYLCST